MKHWIRNLPEVGKYGRLLALKIESHHEQVEAAKQKLQRLELELAQVEKDIIEEISKEYSDA